MTKEFLVHALAITGTVLYVVRAVPATITLARGQTVDPGMGRTLGLLVLTGAWWTTYSIEIGNWPTLVSSALSLVAPTYGLLLLWRQRELQRGVVLVLAVGLLVGFLEEELRPARALGVTAAVGSARPHASRDAAAASGSQSIGCPHIARDLGPDGRQRGRVARVRATDRTLPPWCRGSHPTTLLDHRHATDRARPQSGGLHVGVAGLRSSTAALQDKHGRVGTLSPIYGRIMRC